MAVNRRGQVFLLGGLLLLVLLSGALLFTHGATFVSPETQATKSVFDRALAEFPRAVTLAAAENMSADVVQRQLHTYLAVQRDAFAGHAVDSRGHAVVAVPSFDDVAVIVFNRRRQAMTDLAVTVDGTRKTRASLGAGNSTQFRFPDVPERFTVRASFDADRSFNQTLSATRGAAAALFALRLDGERQRWVAARRS